MEQFLNGKVSLYRGDCLEVLPTLEECSVDSVVCDPPYHLTVIKSGSCFPGRREAIKQGQQRGFMGKQWDGGDIAFRPEVWMEVLRVLKPGGHLLAFSGTRTYHRMACAIEDAGFEIRDQIGYAFGSGFPKSHNVSKILSEQACQCSLRPLRNSNVSETGTTEDASGEVLLASVSQQGAPPTGRTELSNHARARQPSVEGRGNLPETPRKLCEREIRSLSTGANSNGSSGRLHNGASSSDGAEDSAVTDPDRVRASHRPSTAQQSSEEFGAMAGQPQPQDSRAWPTCGGCGKPIVPDGLGTALKPAWEPICLARKPITESSIAANVLKHGTGAINVDACRVRVDPIADASQLRTMQRNQRTDDTSGQTWGLSKDSSDKPQVVRADGRWPANLIHDGSEEVLEGFPETTSGKGKSNYVQDHNAPFGGGQHSCANEHPDSGSAARFFYTAKADVDDRLGSKHPTIKPIDLMQYLVRLVTPKNGVCLDPFAGTGTTAEAAYYEGMRAILIEREPEYQADIVKRMGLVLSGPDRRRGASIKQESLDDTPLFGRLVQTADQ